MLYRNWKLAEFLRNFSESPYAHFISDILNFKKKKGYSSGDKLKIILRISFHIHPNLIILLRA